MKVEIENPRFVRKRDIGIQKDMSFLIPPEYIDYTAIIAIGGIVTESAGGNDGGRVLIENPTTIMTKAVGTGGQENANGRIRVRVPNDQRGSIVVVVVL